MHPKRAEDVRETYGERVLLFGVPGIIALGLGAVMISYQGMLVGLGYVLAIGGAGAIMFSLYNLFRLRSVDSIVQVCPYCQASNHLTEAPGDGYTCAECHRVVPMDDGRVLAIKTVTCGGCGASNFYSDRTTRLLCEGCGKEVALATQEASGPFFAVPKGPDPDELVQLELISGGPNQEEMIACLEKMLHFNRAQVEDLLGDLPASLFTGIPRHRAEMLAAQISVHGGEAVLRPVATLP
jgi:hypothetical protein